VNRVVLDVTIKPPGRLSGSRQTMSERIAFSRWRRLSGLERGHSRGGQGRGQTRLGNHRLSSTATRFADLRHRSLDYHEMDGLLHLGGTISAQRIRGGRGQDRPRRGHENSEEVLDRTKRNIAQLGLRALVCVGGDGSLTIAQQLFEHGVPLVGVPKRMQRSEATVITFGFDSAVACAIGRARPLRTTAETTIASWCSK